MKTCRWAAHAKSFCQFEGTSNAAAAICQTPRVFMGPLVATRGSCCCILMCVYAPPGQELVKLVNSRLGEGVEPLRVGSLPRWQLALPDMKDR